MAAGLRWRDAGPEGILLRWTEVGKKGEGRCVMLKGKVGLEGKMPSRKLWFSKF